MPQSVVQAGLIDFVLPPEEIAKRLATIRSHPYVTSDGGHPTTGVDDGQLKDLCAAIAARTGVDFAQYKPTTLKRRIHRRMALHKLKNIGEYIRLVQKTPKEAEELHNDILITVTSFFREPEAFEALKSVVLKAIFEGKGREEARIWVPACASGEEAYSIAIAIKEFLAEKAPAKTAHLFATDVNERALERARLGVYPESIADEVSPERLKRFFAKMDGAFQVKEAVREMCLFAHQNVIKDPPFSKLDLISCRNLLIYFDDELQERVIPMFHYALRTGGFLMLGSSETLGSFSQHFAMVDKKHKIYEKKNDSPRLLQHFMSPSRRVLERSDNLPARPHAGGVSMERQFDRTLLEKFVPPSIVLTEQLEIVHLRGDTGPYLEPPSGQPSFNLGKMARDGLLFDIRAAIKKVKTTGRTASCTIRLFALRTSTFVTNFEVHPFTGAGSQERYYIVNFDAAKQRDRKGPPAKYGELPPSGRGVEKLRKELERTKEHLKSLIEDHQTTLEEYRSANEEVMSSSEELQSLNEELETAKEELQSSNEELATLNDELQSRNAQLAGANDDLTNVFVNAGVPLLMVNTDLIIRNFTPQAQPLLNLQEGDIGKYLGSTRPALRELNLLETVRDVIAAMSPHEQEVQTNDGRWYLMHVRAYKTRNYVIGGAVITFQDIDHLKRSLDESRSYTATLIESARNPIVILDATLRVVTANNAFYRTFLNEPKDTEGKLFHEVGSGEWNVRPLREALEQLLPKQTRIDDFEVRADFAGIGARVMLVNARRIESQIRKEMILLSIDDITELRRSEQALRRISGRILNIEDTQRRQIARDLHDVTGQKVAALRLNARLVLKQVPRGEAARTLKESVDLVDEITYEIRSLSYMLHPPMLDVVGLVPALREYISGVGERTGLRIKMNVEEAFPELPDDIGLTIFRIVQECLTNTHRHSRASKVEINLRRENSTIEIQVADFVPGATRLKNNGGKKDGTTRTTDAGGKAGAAEEKTITTGVGIAAMKERLGNVGGDIQILKNGGGVLVLARIPLPEKAT